MARTAKLNLSADGAVAMPTPNPAAGVDALRTAYRRADSATSRRGTILAESVRDFCQLERPDHADISRFKELFYQLIQSLGIAERRSLSASLASNHYIPRTVVLFLAMDELEVAAPVLLFSPVINESDILSLARRLDTEHLKVLARRENLTRESARALRHAGGREVAEILVRNRSLSDHEEPQRAAENPAPQPVPITRKAPVSADANPQSPPPLPQKDGSARELVDLAARGGRLGRAKPDVTAAAEKAGSTEPSEASIAAGRELLEAHRNGAAEGFIAAAAYRTGVRAAIIRAMIEKLDGESLAVLLKGMAVEDLEAMQLFVRMLPHVGRDFAKYKSLQATYRKLNAERCKLAMLALSGTRLGPEHTHEPKAPSQRLMDVAAQRRAGLNQNSRARAEIGERSPPRGFGRAARA